jgi:UDP-N-acetylmuramoylalanine--D-glutamate ligase
MREVATTFGGVEHRLEIVRQHKGILWVNDSIATAPERTAAALRSFKETIVLLLGGRDKNLPWDECVAQVVSRADGAPRVRQVILFGEAAPLIQAAFEGRRRSHGDLTIPITACADLEQAVRLAAHEAKPGDVVLLAPGGTSFDAYPDFEARGRHFRALVEALS